MPQLTPEAPPPGPRPVRAGDRQRLVRGLSRPAAGPVGDPIVAFGGDAAFGRGQARPWPARLAERLGRPVLNLAVEGAGPAFVLGDPGLMARAAGTGPVLVEAAGLWSAPNPWYAVGRRHPRRVRAISPALRALFPDLPLEAVSDLGRLLRLMAWRDPARFALVAADLRTAWRDATAELLRALGPGAILLAPSPGTPAAFPSELHGSEPSPAALSAATPADPALASEAAVAAGAPLALARPAPGESPAEAASRAAAHAVAHLTHAPAATPATPLRPETPAAATLPRAAVFPPPSTLARVAAAPR